MTIDPQIQAEQIVKRFCQEKITSSWPIVGKGFVNQVYGVETDSRKIIVRLNNADTYSEYLKEQWCIQQAAAAGIPGPQVLAVGIEDECAYMIQSFVEGSNGLDGDLPGTDIWRQLGEYARVIHHIPVHGSGDKLTDPLHGTFYSPPHPGSDGSWEGYVRYNIESLNERDPMLELGVITERQSQQIKQIFEKWAAKRVRFGLIHGDLSAQNVLVNKVHTTESDYQVSITLLDWGGAEVYPVPHGELIQLLLTQFRDGRPSKQELEVFMEAYGIGVEELAETKELMLLRSFDTLRWAIDCAPEKVEEFSNWVRYSVGMVINDLSRY